MKLGLRNDILHDIPKCDPSRTYICTLWE